MTILMEQDVESDLPVQLNEDIERVIQQTLYLEHCPYECEVNITFTDNDGIRMINREFVNLDVPTDVLSFPMVDYKEPADYDYLETEEAQISCFNPESGELLLGDIIISLERADEQAKEYGHSVRREICFLVAHSMLHLLGYDHMEDEERLVMEAKQKEVLDTLGITRKLGGVSKKHGSESKQSRRIFEAGKYSCSRINFSSIDRYVLPYPARKYYWRCR